MPNPGAYCQITVRNGEVHIQKPIFCILPVNEICRLGTALYPDCFKKSAISSAIPFARVVVRTLLVSRVHDPFFGNKVL